MFAIFNNNNNNNNNNLLPPNGEREIQFVTTILT